MILLHHPNCSKSRSAQEICTNYSNETIVLRDYLTDPLSVSELDKMISNYKGTITDFVRNTDQGFDEKWNHEAFNPENIVRFLAHHPSFLQRPILWDDKQVIIGRPPSLIEDYLQKA